MTRYEMSDLGICDFIDVLEESVLMHARVRVELLDGDTFEDRIRDVTTEGGQDTAVFANHEPVQVRDIRALIREPLAHGYKRDPKHERVPHRNT